LLPSPILFPSYYKAEASAIFFHPEEEDGEDGTTDTTPTRRRPALPHGLPVESDYKQAQQIVDALWNHVAQRHELTETQWRDVLYRITVGELFFHPRRVAVATLLPTNYRELYQAYALGVQNYRLQKRTDQTQDDDHEYRFCLDTIRVESVHQGGTGGGDDEYSHYGALTTTSFAKSDVVAVSPLIYIPDKVKAMAITTVQNGTTSSQNNTVQLMENYCFGHRQTNSLLCPTTQAAFIRHTPHRELANVKLQWAGSSTNSPWPFSQSLLGGTLDQYTVDPNNLSSYATTKLAVEYVALRDIAQNEELLLYRGDQHDDDAMGQQQHSASTPPPPPLPPPLPKKIALSSELEYYQYQCKLYPNMKIQAGEQYRQWEDYATNRMMDPNNWPENIQFRYQDSQYAAWYPCRVVAIDEDEHDYHIEVYGKGLYERGVIRRLRMTPPDRIRIVSPPYRTNLHRPSAVRQYFPIPDDIFPARWRKDYKPGKYWNIGAIPDSNSLYDYETSLRSVKCGLYLATSSIPNAGIGVFTGVDIPSKGITLGSSFPGIVVNIGVNDTDDWVGSNYVWGGSTFMLEYDGYPDFSVSILNVLMG
jgi:hypothetical protein